MQYGYFLVARAKSHAHSDDAIVPFPTSIQVDVSRKNFGFARGPSSLCDFRRVVHTTAQYFRRWFTLGALAILFLPCPALLCRVFLSWHRSRTPSHRR